MNARDTTYLLVPVPNLALMIRCVTPAFFGVSNRVAVPSPLLVKVKCFGSEPFSVEVCAGSGSWVTTPARPDRQPFRRNG